MKNHPRGSLWNCWDPHIHTPGTILADNFVEPTAWEDFITKIEESSPRIRALGITDYLSVEGYERVVSEKCAGRLKDVELIFPNVELRFGIAAEKNSAINFHLLVCPDDQNHIGELKRFLRTLTFSFKGRDYSCERSDIIDLGRAFKGSGIEEHVALKEGTIQFKINFDQLRDKFKSNPWAQENILVAVAASSSDGVAALQVDNSFTATRDELQRHANIIFSGTPKTIQFWLGKGTASLDVITNKWNGPKPCLQGSDAHENTYVGNPEHGKYCWIKGDLSFDTLKQICLEPAGRVFLGKQPPSGSRTSQTISEVSISGADWLRTNNIEINSGLVTIIGARGSGKTALADLIAAGSFALSPHLNERSFIRRATAHLENAASSIIWGDASTTQNQIKHIEMEDLIDYPRVQYLSQQFVDQLCSSEGLTDELLTEIERVIFQAHPPENRLGTTSFQELLAERTQAVRQRRVQNEAVVSASSDDQMTEQAKRDSLGDLRSQRDAKSKSIERDKQDRQKLVPKKQTDNALQLEKVSTALSVVRGHIDRWTRQHNALTALQAEVQAFKAFGSNTALAQQRARHVSTGLDDEQWKSFKLDYVGDVTVILADKIRNAEEQISAWKGQLVPIAGASPDVTADPSTVSFLKPGVELEQQSATALQKEEDRVRKLLGIDEDNSRRYNEVSQKISKDEILIGKINRDIEDAEKANARITELTARRFQAYRNVFECIIAEEASLEELYAPLQHILQSQPGVIGKLAFSVQRVVDLDKWAYEGEELFDLRAAGPFKGRGAILANARDKGLDRAWRSGTADDVANAVTQFRSDYASEFMKQCPIPKDDRQGRRNWALSVFNWLYGTQHITVSYGIKYDNVDIVQLSPGTRGIVLLLLYLAIDQSDDRPLIIDQPEENLDPKSVFDELVPRFKDARLRRQIIVVTHNANLVVNTDADQVIVAKAGAHRPGELPEITYVSGGLENPVIRKEVCEILEGGETAFRQRAKRLRVMLDG